MIALIVYLTSRAFISFGFISRVLNDGINEELYFQFIIVIEIFSNNLIVRRRLQALILLNLQVKLIWLTACKCLPSDQLILVL
jgi:hypothetical protein